MADNIKRFLTKEVPWGTYTIYKRESESLWHVDLSDSNDLYCHLGEKATLDEAYQLYCKELQEAIDARIIRLKEEIEVLKKIEV